MWEGYEYPRITRQYSYDGKTWITAGPIDDVDIELTKGSKIYLRGKIVVGYDHSWYSDYDDKYQHIGIYGNVILSGNLGYLYDYDNPEKELNDTCVFYNLFSYGNAIVDAKNLILPSKLNTGCFWKTFNNSGLIAAPELLAKELMDGYSYDHHRNVGCYENMFTNCSNLNYIKCLAENPDEKYTTNWLQGVSSTGTFVKKKDVEWPRGDSGIPNGWEIIEVDE